MRVRSKKIVSLKMLKDLLKCRKYGTLMTKLRFEIRNFKFEILLARYVQ